MARQDKGGKFERESCRMLSLWWTEGEFDDCLWRNRLRRTTKAYNAQIQEGDITAVREIAIVLTEVLSIECKAGYSIKRSPTKKTAAKKAQQKQKTHNVPWDLLDIIDGKHKKTKPVIFQFWDQTLKAARLVERHPLLLFRRDFHEPGVCIEGELRGKLFELAGPPRREIRLLDPDHNLYFYSAEDFFTWIEPHHIRKLHEGRRFEYADSASLHGKESKRGI